MKSLQGYYIMWTFKEVVRRIIIKNTGISNYSTFFHKIPTTRAHFPNCVQFFLQQNSSSSNQSLKSFNPYPNYYLLQGSVQRCCYTTAATAQDGLEPGDDKSLSKIPELTFIEINNRNDELEDSIGDEIEIDEKLEEKRRIWNVGPACRPSFNLAPFVNESKVLKNFVKMGVELHRWDKIHWQNPKLMEHILKMDFDKDVAPYIRFLVDLGIPPSQLHKQFTENPGILQEDIRNLEIRIKYLHSKKFEKDAIIRIIDTYPKWLSLSVSYIDSQLGIYQSKFSLTGAQVRQLAAINPRVITLKYAQIEQVTFTIMEEMGFSPEEVVKLLMAHPAIWKSTPQQLWGRFNYLHNIVKLSHSMILNSSKVLLARESRLRSRIGYLQKIARAQFDPNEPNYISMEEIIIGTDTEFAEKIAKSTVVEYNEYLKSM